MHVARKAPGGRDEGTNRVSDTNNSTTSIDLGAKLRALRQERRWTLERVAESSGLSISALSKIENGLVSASFDTLVKIAHAYGYSFAELFSGKEPAPRQSIAGRRTVTRAAQGLSFNTPYYDYNVHSAELTHKGMIPLVMHIRTRETPPAGDWSTHEGEEFIYVVEGVVVLHTEFYSPVRLASGDSAYIDSMMRHAFVNVGEGDALILSVCMTEQLYFDDVAVGK